VRAEVFRPVLLLVACCVNTRFFVVVSYEHNVSWFFFFFPSSLLHAHSPPTPTTGAFDDPNGAHIAIEVISEKFAGKRPVQRQQMVYKALWEELKDPGGRVHAVDSMTCKTPEEVGN